MVILEAADFIGNEAALKQDIHNRMNPYVLSLPGLFMNFQEARMLPLGTFRWQHPSNNFTQYFDRAESNTSREEPACLRLQTLYPEYDHDVLTAVSEVQARTADSYYVLELEELKLAYCVMRLLVSRSDRFSDNPRHLID